MSTQPSTDLSPKEHWDYVHEHERKDWAGRSGRESGLFSRSGPLRKALRDKTRAYDDYLLLDVILRRHLPDMRGRRLLEIGSAPGEFVSGFAKAHGFIPYGMDYSDGGVAVNKEVFAANGFDPANVIQADLFSDELQGRLKNNFDAVFSRGFVEHFTDLDRPINAHMNLLAPGGHLIISIPNLRGGVNYGLTRMLDPDVIAIHNLEIMQRETFRKLFEREDLEPLFCDYYGTFSFYMLTAGKHPVQRAALKMGHRVQPGLNMLFRLLFGDRGLETPWFSPALVYVGRKKK